MLLTGKHRSTEIWYTCSFSFEECPLVVEEDSNTITSTPKGLEVNVYTSTSYVTLVTFLVQKRTFTAASNDIMTNIGIKKLFGVTVARKSFTALLVNPSFISNWVMSFHVTFKVFINNKQCSYFLLPRECQEYRTNVMIVK